MEAFIRDKGGKITLDGSIDCDEIFAVPNPPDETTLKILGNLWLDGDEDLPRLIESELSTGRKSSATREACDELYTSEIFCRQKYRPYGKPTLIRRFGELALQITSAQQHQPLPPNIQSEKCKSEPSSALVIMDITPGLPLSTSGRGLSTKLESIQPSRPGAPHSGAAQERLQRNVQELSGKISSNTRSAGSARNVQSTGVSVLSVVQAVRATSGPYTDFVVDVQYWLSDQILEPGLQKLATAWVPKLYNGNPFNAPYLTVLLAKYAGDKEEYRRKLIAASSICLYRSYRLSESNEKEAAQLTQEADSRPSSTGQEEYKTRAKVHFGILVDELAF